MVIAHLTGTACSAGVLRIGRKTAQGQKFACDARAEHVCKTTDSVAKLPSGNGLTPNDCWYRRLSGEVTLRGALILIVRLASGLVVRIARRTWPAA